MGRELRRKEERKERKNKKVEEEIEFKLSGLTVLKVLSSIVLILFVAYYILAVFITKEIDISEKKDSSDTTAETSNNSSDKIVAKNIFNQQEDVYYVYCYDFSDEDSGVRDAINGASSKKIYRLDTSDGFNSNYVTEEDGNKEAKTLEELKIKNPTLIEITGDTITGYYEGRTNIITYLGN